MIDLLSVLNSDDPLPRTMRFLLTEAQARLGGSAAVFVRADESSGTADVQMVSGLADDRVPRGPLFRVCERDTVLGTLVFGADPWMRVVFDEPAWLHMLTQVSVNDQNRAWLTELTDGYGAMLCVPVDINDNRYGSLWVVYASSTGPTAAQPQMVEEVHDLVSLALENALLRQKAEQAVILQERSRLARDLHDSVTQSLYSLTLMIEASRRLAKEGDISKVQQALARLELIGMQALKEMRLLVYQLRPSVLRRVGLMRALTQRLETVEKRAGVVTELSVVGSPELSPFLDEQLYYVAQEALNNALKHAGATHVSVRIIGDGAELSLEIIDNGKGFDVASIEAEGGFGLAGMRERVDRLGGRLSICSDRGVGTRVSVLLHHPGDDSP